MSVTPVALAGIRILDFSRVLAGPYCTMLLADYGAEVIKIERPGSGDDTRQWGPPYVGDPSRLMSAYYVSLNRNKYSVTLDLKSVEGQQIARRLVGFCDVIVENFKLGQMAEYGLAYKSLCEEYPSLIYCSVTGYGQTGDYAERAGYDFIVQGQSGLMSITGEVDGDPYKVGVAISDVLTGLFAANAIQTALLYRARTGHGQYIDLALLDSQMAALVNVASNYLISDNAPARYGNAHPNIVPYEAFYASDGMFNLGVGTDIQFQALCRVIDRPELASDPLYATNPRRLANREQLIAILHAVFVQQPVAYWINLLNTAGIPCGEINNIPAALNHPQVQAREMVQNVKLSSGEEIKVVATPAKFSITPALLHQPPPFVGEHTTQILQEWLGLDSDMLEDYRRRGII